MLQIIGVRATGLRKKRIGKKSHPGPGERRRANREARFQARRILNLALLGKKMNKNFGILFVKFWLPVYFYAAVIFFLSSMPPPPAVAQPPFMDKIFHLGEYAIFGFLLARAFKSSQKGYFASNFRLLAIGCAVIYGLTDELHQAFVPFREASLFDLLFDGLGATLGGLCVTSVVADRRKKGF